MKTKRKTLSQLSVLLLALPFIGFGCRSTQPVAWNLNITKTTYSTIEVDLIGVPRGGKPLWEGYDMDQYWKPGDQRRQDAHPLSKDLVYWVMHIKKMQRLKLILDRVQKSF